MATERESQVRSATRDDLAELLRIEQASFPVADAFSRRQYRDLLANPAVTIRVICVQAGRCSASAILLRNGRGPGGRPSARLYSIAVDPASRGLGLGAMLLTDLIDICRRERIGTLRLEVRADNHPAIALYRRFGFQVERDLPDYYGPGQPGLKMALEILHFTGR